MRELLWIFLLQVCVLVLVAMLVFLRKKRDAEMFDSFYDNYDPRQFYQALANQSQIALMNNDNNNGDYSLRNYVNLNNTAMLMKVDDDPSKSNGRVLNVQVDKGVSKLNVSSVNISGNNNNATQNNTLLTYDLRNPSVAYGVPLYAMSNLVAMNGLMTPQGVVANTLDTQSIKLPAEWTVAQQNNNLNFQQGGNNNLVVGGGGISAPTMRANNINITQNGGCLSGNNTQLCLRDGQLLGGNATFGNANFGHVSSSAINTGQVQAGSLQANGASIAGIGFGSSNIVSNPTTNPLVVQTIDADLIKLRNNNMLGLGGEVKIGEFRFTEDKPGILRLYYKSRRVLDLDTTGSKSTDLSVYNMDDIEKYVTMSSSTTLLEKNVPPD